MKKARRYLRILLWLIAIHSFTVACLLICLGDTGIMHFGFAGGNKFFQVQGGVFHIVMCIAYLLAAYDLNNNKLIIFIIAAKSVATVYLLAYYLIIDPVITVLLSGLLDGLMALLVWFFWKAMLKEVHYG